MSRVRLARNEEKIAFTLLHNHDKEMFSCNENVDDFWFREWGSIQFLAVQDSSIGDLVTHSLRHVLIRA